MFKEILLKRKKNLITKAKLLKRGDKIIATKRNSERKKRYKKRELIGNKKNNKIKVETKPKIKLEINLKKKTKIHEIS